ncbi:MAG TPA: efflux RND transporter periplasmic adaptor subunit [Acidobacteria bacterium]|nr:efflux RND transporter periplasmic adaptor subunit [Acidobacteriota bacterium]
MKKLAWIVVAVLITGGLLAIRMVRVHQKDSAPLVRQAAPGVEVVPVRSGRVARVRHVTGTIIADEEAQVAPRIMAQILEVRVRQGDVVRTGQVLAVLDARELEDAVAQAGAGLSAAREAVAAAEAAWEAQRGVTERDRVLHEAKALSDEQWERSRATERATRARLEAARAELRMSQKRHDQARTRRGYAFLKAPFDGKVTARLADPGDLALPGKPVLAVAREGSLRVRAGLPVADLSVLALGDPVTVSADGTMVKAAVSRIVPATGPTGLATFEADLPDAPKTFVPGATVGVDVVLRQAEGLVVPVDTLLRGERGTSVFVVERTGSRPAGSEEKAKHTGTVRPVRVEVLARSVDEAVVRGDLADGDQVIVAQPARLMTLAAGMPVEVTAIHDGEAAE